MKCVPLRTKVLRMEHKCVIIQQNTCTLPSVSSRGWGPVKKRNKESVADLFCVFFSTGLACTCTLKNKQTPSLSPSLPLPLPPSLPPSKEEKKEGKERKGPNFLLHFCQDNNLERAADWIFSHAHELDSMDVDNEDSQETGPKFIDGPGSKLWISALYGNMVRTVLKSP